MLEETTAPFWRTPYADTLLQWIFEPDPLIHIVTGPRGAGKTTMVLQVLQECGQPYHYAVPNLQSTEYPSWITEQWEQGQTVSNDNGGAALVLDEIQNISNWPETIKFLQDRDGRSGAKMPVIIVGPSHLLDQTDMSQALEGYFAISRIPHWNYGETEKAFGWSLEEFILQGGFPGTGPMIREPERLASYIRDSIIEPTISEDLHVLFGRRTQRSELVRSLLNLACTRCSEIMTYQRIMEESPEGSVPTLKRYLHYLYLASLVDLPEKYIKEIPINSTSPRLQPLSTGLATTYSSVSLEEWRQQPDLWTQLVKCAVGAHLHNWAFASRRNIYHWTKTQYQVDFVIPNGERLAAIQINDGRSNIESSLEQFAKSYRNTTPLTIGPDGIPLEEFLSNPPTVWLTAR